MNIIHQIHCDRIKSVNKITGLSEELRRIASDKGFIISENSDNSAPGNCMFDALSKQLQIVKGIQISHSELRKIIVQSLGNFSNLVSQTNKQTMTIITEARCAGVEKN